MGNADRVFKTVHHVGELRRACLRLVHQVDNAWNVALCLLPRLRVRDGLPPVLEARVESNNDRKFAGLYLWKDTVNAWNSQSAGEVREPLGRLGDAIDSSLGFFALRVADTGVQRLEVFDHVCDGVVIA